MSGGTVTAVWYALVNIYAMTILVYILMSWFAPSGVFYDIYRFLGTVCEPYLGIFRRFIPVTGGLDFSPMVAYLVLQFLVRPLGGAILSGIGL